MFKKSTSTSRICDNRLTPIQWGSTLFFGGQYVNPLKKPKPVVYSTKSHSRIDAFEIYDATYNRKLKKLWLGSDKNNIADKFIYFKNGDLKYIELFHKKCAENSATYYWLAKDHISTLGGIDGKK